jgi:hypothetical protein
MTQATPTLRCRFDALIQPDWKLKREGNYWQLHEPGAGNKLFEIGGGRSVAFSLDRKEINVFPFFGTALAGVHQVNDAVVVAHVDGKAYVAAVEMKTSPGEKRKALKQIESARLFIEWAVQLLHLHGHCANDYTFFGIISLKPRKQPRKGSSRRCAELPMPEASPYGSGYPVFVLENHPRTSIPDLVKKTKN